MWKWITFLFESLMHFFRWRAQVTDPLVDYRKAYDEWEVELERLERMLNEARTAYINHCLAGKSDNGRMFGIWKQASNDVRNHRAREPKCKDYRAE